MKQSILIIDDSEDDLRLYRRALKDIGYILEIATNAAAGLAAALAIKPSLILLDYKLPDMDGLEFMKKLIGNSAVEAPVIMLTGEGSESVAVEAMKLGASDYVVKDVAGGFLRLLPSVIRRVLNAHADKIATQKLKALHQTILHTVADGVIGVDNHGRVLFANKSAEQMLLTNPNGLIGRDVTHLLWPDGNPSDSSNHPLLVMAKDMSNLMRDSDYLRRENGELFPVSYTASHLDINDEHNNGWVLVFQDITARKNALRIAMEAKATLEESEIKYRQLFESSSDGIYLQDATGGFIDCNENGARLFGLSKNELIGRSPADFFPEKQPDGRLSADVAGEKFASALNGKPRRFEFKTRRANGDLFDAIVLLNRIEIRGAYYIHVVARDITESKLAEEKLRQQSQFSDDIIKSLPGIFYMLNQQGQFIRVNNQFFEVSDYTKDELDRMTALDFFEGDDKSLIAQKMQEVFEIGNTSVEADFIAKSGQKSPYYFTGQRTFIDNQTYLVGLGTDITERKKAEDDLRIAAATFETHDAIVITDQQANIVRVNQAFTEITGYSQEEVQGRNPRLMSSGRQDRAFYIEMWQQLLHTGSWSGEIWDRRKNGQVYPKWMTITAVKNEQQETTHYVAIFSDITARKQAEEEIRNLAFYDTLTRLPNRRLFMERFRTALAASARRNEYGAILFIDLDRFKALNDTLGHDYGDLLLIDVGVRIKTCIREMDTVARFGGDEFVVLIEAVSNDRDDATRKVAGVGEKIREALARPYKLKEHEHHSSPSIGISLYHGHDESMDVLIEHADMAMYQVKNAGRNGVRFFDPLMQEHMATHDVLDNDLHYAIELQQLHLHYQIQVDNDKRPLGAEAFLRWIHPERGLIMPGQFLPIAEESNLIIDIGRWVLQTAYHQLVLWSKNDKTCDLTLTVNISAKHFAQPNFVNEIADILKSGQVEPTRLKLELSERLVMTDMNTAKNKIHALRNLGVRLSMDNFGTVYSSLSFLKHLSSDQLKIHQEFVQGITQGGNDAQLIQAVIDLAKSMDLGVFAEGVETEEQRAFLENHDCNAYQGYLFGKPVPIEEFEEYIG